MKKIAVVIVNYNGGDFIRTCLNALISQTVKPEKIIVVDNGSSDGSLDTIREFSDAVDILDMRENAGFAKANNTAINNLDGYDWVALLNPDAIPAPDWIEQLHNAISNHPRHSSFACCMLQISDTNIIDGCGDAYHVNGIAWPRYKGMPRGQTDQSPHETFSACGGAAMYNREVFIGQGGFDERYFCYHEDVDLGFRLRLANERCMYIPSAIVYHAGSAITGKGSDFSVYYAHRNMLWTFVKDMPQPMFMIFFIPHLVVNMITLLNFIVKGRSRIIFKAKIDAIKGIPSMMRSRRIIQQHRSITCAALLSTMQYGWLGRTFLRIAKSFGRA